MSEDLAEDEGLQTRSLLASILNEVVAGDNFFSDYESLLMADAPGGEIDSFHPMANFRKSIFSFMAANKNSPKIAHFSFLSYQAFSAKCKENSAILFEKRRQVEIRWFLRLIRVWRSTTNERIVCKSLSHFAEVNPLRGASEPILATFRSIMMLFSRVPSIQLALANLHHSLLVDNERLFAETVKLSVSSSSSTRVELLRFCKRVGCGLKYLRHVLAADCASPKDDSEYLGEFRLLCSTISSPDADQIVQLFKNSLFASYSPTTNDPKRFAGNQSGALSLQFVAIAPVTFDYVLKSWELDACVSWRFPFSPKLVAERWTRIQSEMPNLDNLKLHVALSTIQKHEKEKILAISECLSVENAEWACNVFLPWALSAEGLGAGVFERCSKILIESKIKIPAWVFDSSLMREFISKEAANQLASIIENGRLPVELFDAFQLYQALRKNSNWKDVNLSRLRILDSFPLSKLLSDSDFFSERNLPFLKNILSKASSVRSSILKAIFSGAVASLPARCAAVEYAIAHKEPIPLQFAESLSAEVTKSQVVEISSKELSALATCLHDAGSTELGKLQKLSQQLCHQNSDYIRCFFRVKPADEIVKEMIRLNVSSSIFQELMQQTPNSDPAMLNVLMLLGELLYFMPKIQSEQPKTASKILEYASVLLQMPTKCVATLRVVDTLLGNVMLSKSQGCCDCIISFLGNYCKALGQQKGNGRQLEYGVQAMILNFIIAAGESSSHAQIATICQIVSILMSFGALDTLTALFSDSLVTIVQRYARLTADSDFLLLSQCQSSLNRLFTSFNRYARQFRKYSARIIGTLINEIVKWPTPALRIDFTPFVFALLDCCGEEEASYLTLVLFSEDAAKSLFRTFYDTYQKSIRFKGKI